jgi:cell division transport system permease protein
MGVFMKSFKNHFSLIVALFSILFAIQVFIVVDRSILSYKLNLASNYSVIVVSQKNIRENTMLSINNIIESSNELSADNVIKRFSSDIDKKNKELLKLYLPKFYKLNLTYYPSLNELEELKSDLLINENITKVEDFSRSHDTIYKLLLLFKDVVSVFSIVILIVTVLLIFKELKIWQYKHNERMTIMGFFGAATWLRSAVLFRLAIVDALVSSALVLIAFTYLNSSEFILNQLNFIGIKITIFDMLNDFLLLLSVSIGISLFLVVLIILGHKEEV